MHILHPVLFLLVYLCAVLGNILIIMITALDHHLHAPMYFSLKNLSFLDLCLISITAPKSIANSLTQTKSISFLGCFAQVFLSHFSASAELPLLTVMSFDHYAAICQPLHYAVIIIRGKCVQTAAVSWLFGGLIAVMHTASTFSLLHSGSSMVHQLFCDIPQLLAISGSENLIREIVPILINVVFDFCCFIFIIIFYVYVFSTVKRIPYTEGKSTVYSTCLPHLVVVVLFLSTGFIAYLKSTSESPSILDLVISVFYTVLPTNLSPIIHSLRNKAMKMALEMLIKGKLTKK